MEIHQGPHVAETRQGPTQDRLLGCSGLVIWKSPLQGQAWKAHLSYSLEGGSKGTHPRRHRLSVDSSAVTPALSSAENGASYGGVRGDLELAD